MHTLDIFSIYITKWFVCIYFRQFALSDQMTPELLSDANFTLVFSLNLHIIEAVARQQKVCVCVCAYARKCTLKYEVKHK